jgi:predicted HAD superfamily Cof-like phosphohydrolase
MKKALEQVTEFHNIFKIYSQDRPKLPQKVTRDLRKRILKEEYEEYQQAEDDDDLVEIADALADMIYVIIGTAVSYGIPIDKVFDEVHASNMSKLGTNGQPIYRSDGKISKGENFFEPNIKKLVDG